MKDVKIVIGANFGDEGKGQMTDYFAAEAAEMGHTCLVVCSNGGAQRGHTVLTPEGVRHVFHHFGSGTLAGADTYLPGYFILNPMIFMNEYDELDAIANGGKIGTFRKMPKVYISPYSPVSTPYDMITNQIVEAARGNDRHGSCGIGIWETLVRIGADGVLLGEMIKMTDRELEEYLTKDCKNYMEERLSKLGVEVIPDKWKDIIDDPGLVENYIADFRMMMEMCEIIDEAENVDREVDGQFGFHKLFHGYDRVIFENGQGLLLDRCRKEYGCNTTPSNTGFRNPAELIREYMHSREGREYLYSRYNRSENELQKRENINELFEKTDVEVCYVTRTYLTRHGAGRFSEECSKEDINPDMTDMTNVPNPFQGTLRYGLLDETAFRKRIREDFDSERLPINCTAHLSIAVTHVNEYECEIIKSADYIFNGETRQDVRKR